jgi:hypothetical protein
MTTSMPDVTERHALVAVLTMQRKYLLAFLATSAFYANVIWPTRISGGIRRARVMSAIRFL